MPCFIYATTALKRRRALAALRSVLNESVCLALKSKAMPGLERDHPGNDDRSPCCASGREGELCEVLKSPGPVSLPGLPTFGRTIWHTALDYPGITDSGHLRTAASVARRFGRRIDVSKRSLCDVSPNPE